MSIFIVKYIYKLTIRRIYLHNKKCYKIVLVLILLLLNLITSINNILPCSTILNLKISTKNQKKKLYRKYYTVFSTNVDKRREKS